MYRELNLNPEHKRVGDCTVRAIAAAIRPATNEKTRDFFILFSSFITLLFRPVSPIIKYWKEPRCLSNGACMCF